MSRCHLLTLLVLTAYGCSGGGAPSKTPFQVARLIPDIGGDHEEALYLNHQITVQFNGPLDPLSVTSDTLRITGPDGLGVAGELRVGQQSITFEPRPPLSAGLDDGSFKPGAHYRLELAGFPRANALRSADGRVLDHSMSRAFAIMPAAGLGGPSPFLPVSRGDAMFRLRQELPMRMAADLRKLQLRFSLPVLPSSVGIKALEVIQLHPQRGPQPVAIASARVISLPEPQDPFPGCTVEVGFDELAHLSGTLYIKLADGVHAIRDYLGRVPTVLDIPGSYITVTVDPGRRRRLLQEEFDSPEAFEANGDCLPGFTSQAGRAIPQLRSAAGDGALGPFAPKRDLVIRPGEAFDRGDGTWVRAERVLAFTSLRIPTGVRVVLNAAHHPEGMPIVVAVMGSVRIEGALEIRGPGKHVLFAPGDRVSVEDMAKAACCSLIAGGDLQITGQVQQPGLQPGQASMALACGGRLALRGEIPPRTMLALSSGQLVQGSAPQVIGLVLEGGMELGLPGSYAQVESWTHWQALPTDRPLLVDFQLLDPRAVQVAVQIAPPNPIDPSRPLLVAGVLQQPIPIPTQGGLQVPIGNFVRFQLRAQVHAAGGGEWPSLGGVAVVAD